jgi:adenine-specific DNA-methyltransferase
MKSVRICKNIPDPPTPIQQRTAGLTDYAQSLAEEYINGIPSEEQKSKGQFFTPKPISLFMAGLFKMGRQKFKVLDPGAGIGVLSAAVCENVLALGKKTDFSIDAYETDKTIIPLLNKVLHKCKIVLQEKGHKFEYSIIEKDYISVNSPKLGNQFYFDEKESSIFYDYIISNPPYYKLNTNSPQAASMKEIMSGQPNIYTFFMALSLEMLKPDGEMVYITPRSFCSGLYFKSFRKWLLEHGQITNIHMFESRSEVFGKSNVLQENIITKIIPKKNKLLSNRTTITTSKDSMFEHVNSVDIEYKDMLHQVNGERMIKIPTSHIDVEIQHIVNSWKYTLKDFGMKASTGPVISFRAKELLSPEFLDKDSTVPLLWMHNIQEMNVVWPIEKTKKELAIKLNEQSNPLLLPVENYVLVKRFSSKEQKRRLYAGVLLKSKFKYNRVGIENHLNYIYKYKNVLSLNEAFGLAGVFNSSIMDIFFRMINGSTQVNAIDITTLPLPSIEDIRKIGALIQSKKPSIGLELDKIIIRVLGINSGILDEIKGVD